MLFDRLNEARLTGVIEPEFVCMQDKNDGHGRRCTYFHQKFQEIVLSEDGWPFYQRKARIGPRYKWAKSVRGTEFKIDNRWTVLYNLFLHQNIKPILTEKFAVLSNLLNIDYISMLLRVMTE